MLIDPATLLVFAGAALVLNLTPGPDMLYTLARASAGGLRAGVASAIGNFAGTLVQTAAIAVGLGALLAQSATAFTALRWAGAAYLIFVGLRMLLARTPAAADPSRPPAPRRTLARVAIEAFLIHTLNPKVVVFFLAFLPQFMDPARGSATAQMILLGLWFAAQASLVLVVLSAIAGRARRALGSRERLGVWLKRAGGAVFVGLGARLAASP
ncbi:MAG: threonine transporter RhtB [Phycisphaeraceae bacterium]|nr:MAG: threonine transporter RhtB [Phycisphaeraceae bacterium]